MMSDHTHAPRTTHMRVHAPTHSNVQDLFLGVCLCRQMRRICQRDVIGDDQAVVRVVRRPQPVWGDLLSVLARARLFCRVGSEYGRRQIGNGRVHDIVTENLRCSEPARRVEEAQHCFYQRYSCTRCDRAPYMGPAEICTSLCNAWHARVKDCARGGQRSQKRCLAAP